MNFVKRLSILLFTVALASVCFSQQRATLLQASVQLLTAPGVDKDIKLTDAQKKKIESAFRSAQEAEQKIKRPTNEAEAKAAAKKVEQLRMTFWGQALGALSSAQTTRLRQIGMQFYGPLSSIASDIKGMLGINAAQEKKLRALQDDFFKKSNQLNQDGALKAQSIPQPKDPKNKKQVEDYQKAVYQIALTTNKQLKSLKDSTDTKAMAIFTPAQKTKWKQSIGVMFKFQAPSA